MTADTERELDDMARRLKVPKHGKGNQAPHLDVNRHQAELARRYGAKAEGEF